MNWLEEFSDGSINGLGEVFEQVVGGVRAGQGSTGDRLAELLDRNVIVIDKLLLYAQQTGYVERFDKGVDVFWRMSAKLTRKLELKARSNFVLGGKRDWSRRIWKWYLERKHLQLRQQEADEFARSGKRVRFDTQERIAADLGLTQSRIAKAKSGAGELDLGTVALMLLDLRLRASDLPDPPSPKEARVAGIFQLLKPVRKALSNARRIRAATTNMTDDNFALLWLLSFDDKWSVLWAMAAGVEERSILAEKMANRLRAKGTGRPWKDVTGEQLYKLWDDWWIVLLRAVHDIHFDWGDFSEADNL